MNDSVSALLLVGSVIGTVCALLSSGLCVQAFNVKHELGKLALHVSVVLCELTDCTFQKSVGCSSPSFTCRLSGFSKVIGVSCHTSTEQVYVLHNCPHTYLYVSHVDVRCVVNHDSWLGWGWGCECRLSRRSDSRSW